MRRVRMVTRRRRYVPSITQRILRIVEQRLEEKVFEAKNMTISKAQVALLKIAQDKRFLENVINSKYLT